MTTFLFGFVAGVLATVGFVWWVIYGKQPSPPSPDEYQP